MSVCTNLTFALSHLENHPRRCRVIVESQELPRGLSCKATSHRDSACDTFLVANRSLTLQMRVLNGFSYVLRSQRRKQKNSPSDIFLPLVTESHSPFNEIDFNLHKSNSTYVTDHDVARVHLMCTLFAAGIERARFAESNEVIGGGNAQLKAIVAGISCYFKREIPPYSEYEMWTRVVAWERKWIWVATHFVEKVPKKDARTRPRKIYAVAVSKQVFKKGRLTVQPAAMLRLSGLLPSGTESAKDKHREPNGTSDQIAIRSAAEKAESKCQQDLELINSPDGLDKFLHSFSADTDVLARRRGNDHSLLLIPKLAYLFLEYIGEYLMSSCATFLSFGRQKTTKTV